MAQLKKEMPSMIGKEKRKKELISSLDKIYAQLQREHNISPGDFPDIRRMQEVLQHQDFTKFNPLKQKLLDVVDAMLASDIGRLMSQIPKEEEVKKLDGTREKQELKGGAFENANESPFGFGKGEGINAGADERQMVGEWIVSRERYKWDEIFDTLSPIDGKVTGAAAKAHMVKSKLPNSILGKIWRLSDCDKDGMLDADEFSLANYLINLKLEGHEMPGELPSHLIPPSKKGFSANHDTDRTLYPSVH